jgi:hypothetical protein
VLCVKAQAMGWKPYNRMFVCWELFYVNNGLPMDLVNLQILWCIICRYEEETNNVLVQRSIMCKCLIKYNKVNGITSMITHVQIACSKLFALKKQQLNTMVQSTTTHVQQLGKKRPSPFNITITEFLGAAKPLKFL